ncbi:MAG: CHASE2 domain-containing protein [Muribaculaceae bacterium]|nr:CHASE2 domain-containing protein [Muribaculaceae bacterium]
MTDFYNIAADSRPIRAMDRDIVIVNIDRTSREDVIDVLELLSMMNPAAVGVDVTFNQPHDSASNSRLLDAIDALPNAVLAVGVGHTDESRNRFLVDDYSFFYTSKNDFRYGVVNLPSKFDGGTIREFPLRFVTDGGDTLRSMVAELASIVAPGAVDTLMERGSEMETIDFPSRTFEVINWMELPDKPDAVNGKIVFVGAVNEYGDMHRTPVADSMSGVMVHAHALSTLLRGAYYYSVPRWLNITIAFCLCFLFAFINLAINKPFKGLVLRIIQVLILYAIIRIGYSLFVDHRTIVDFSFSLLMLTFALFACDMWIGTSYLIEKTLNKFKK